MKIRHVSVKNFRGIRSLEWNVASDIVCLIGPGDATKSTVLTAIAYSLAPRPFLVLNDADFYAADVSQPIVIEVSVTHPPKHLLTESKYALLQRGWSAENGLSDDPDPSGYPALTIRLFVDDALEPRWTVTKQANDEGRAIGWKDRAALHLFRIDDKIDTHLAWGRGSALAALTADDNEIDSTLTAALRRAREVSFADSHEKLDAAAKSAYEHAVAFGIPPGPYFRPGLDVRAMGGAATLALHQERIPLKYSGIGTKRLVAFAVQRSQISGGSVVLVDEVEYGLEPHRLLHLLQSLREAVAVEATPGLDQIILTTHSPSAVAEMEAGDLHVVGSVAGVTTIRRVTDAFDDADGIDPQAIARAGASALLAKRVIVAEGRTEVGYVRAMASHWNTVRGTPIAHLGTTVMDGGGQQAASRSIGLARLGYQTALLVDSDVALNPPLAIVLEAGVRVIQWADSVSTEERIAHDLPEKELGRLVQLAIELTEDQEAVLSSIGAQLPGLTDPLSTPDVMAWVSPETPIDEIRRAIGKAAKKKKWFKSIERGQRLGELVGELLPQMDGSDTVAKTGDLETFAYGK